ncbi:mRNA binding protein puf3, partial [Spiromyces aspiralis]
MERGKPADRALVYSRIRGNVLELSKHKFASNVVEKCIVYGSFEDRQALINEIVSPNNEDSSNLLAMVKDQYANYVVQKMLDVVENEQKALLLSRIQANIHLLKRYPYGKHLINKVEKHSYDMQLQQSKQQQQRVMSLGAISNGLSSGSSLLNLSTPLSPHNSLQAGQSAEEV